MILSQNPQLSVAFSGSSALITGGLGFIGSHVARRLVDFGARATVIDKLVLGAEFIFNLGGQASHLDSMTDSNTDLGMNEDAQLSILEACRRQNPAIRVVFASTRQRDGAPDFPPVTKEFPTRPVEVNEINKLAGKWYHLLFHDVYVISPRAEGKVINLDSAEVISLERIVHLICEIERKSRYELVPFSKDRKMTDYGDYYADVTMVHKHLGWEPSVSLIEGNTWSLSFNPENSSKYSNK